MFCTLNKGLKGFRANLQGVNRMTSMIMIEILVFRYQNERDRHGNRSLGHRHIECDHMATGALAEADRSNTADTVVTTHLLQYE